VGDLRGAPLADLGLALPLVLVQGNDVTWPLDAREHGSSALLLLDEVRARGLLIEPFDRAEAGLQDAFGAE
jgi:hypothetical protein